MADKGGFPHYMLKEIFEQPQGLRDTIAPRVSLEEAVVRLDEVRISTDELRALRRINIVASGTSRHAGMAGQYMIQDLVNIPVDVDYASEFEYRNPLIGPGELTIVITQSGETADTTAAQREAKAKGSRTIAISNVVDSTIAREADGVLYTHAGPEISIASTKAFTAQMAVLYLFALYLGQVRGKFAKEQRRRVHPRTARFAGQDGSAAAVRACDLQGTGRKVLQGAGLSLHGSRHSLSRGHGRCAQAERSLLHPRRGLSHGRNQAWSRTR